MLYTNHKCIEYLLSYSYMDTSATDLSWNILVLKIVCGENGAIDLLLPSCDRGDGMSVSTPCDQWWWIPLRLTWQDHLSAHLRSHPDWFVIAGYTYYLWHSWEWIESIEHDWNYAYLCKMHNKSFHPLTVYKKSSIISSKKGEKNSEKIQGISKNFCSNVKKKKKKKIHVHSRCDHCWHGL